MTLTDILKDSKYKLTQFSTEQIQKLEESIFTKEVRGKEESFVKCLVRKKYIQLKPEEVVRQLYLMVLNKEYKYDFERMQLEYPISLGSNKKRADIVIIDKNDTRVPYIIIEIKQPKFLDGKEQLKSYCNSTGATIGVWTNGEQISFYNRRDPNYFKEINNIPKSHQTLKELLQEKWTIDDLIERDELVTKKKSLKDKILEMENEVLANAGVDVFEEVFKLIFTKLFDEMESGNDDDRALEFRNYGETEIELKEKMQKIFDEAKDKWQGVFSDDTKIMLSPSHLAVCVSSLEGVKLFNSNLDVVDEAFEYLINKSSKGEKGQFFTPRYVIDMCVKMMNPQEHETVIDTASGSCGFPVHSIFHVWKQILKDEGKQGSHLFSSQKKKGRYSKYVRDKVFAIDFDEKAVRVGRTLNLIAGDGETNVLHLNTLDYEKWIDKYKEDENWRDTYGKGWSNLKKYRTIKNETKENSSYVNRNFEFDVLMANPPFAGDIKESRIVSKYDFGKKVSLEKVKPDNTQLENISDAKTYPDFIESSGETIIQVADGTYRKIQLKSAKKMSRDILFIERNLSFLKDGGRMAIVLPQGRFNNSSDKHIREYIAKYCRILAVVGLHGNAFKPHTGTKTSVLFVQKWDDKLCPKVEDYPIFFATMQEPSKDNSGKKIYQSVTSIHYEGVKYSEEEFYQKYKSLQDATFYVNKKDNQNVINLFDYEKLQDKEKKAYKLSKQPEVITEPLLDTHGHLIVKHDLFNHDGLTQDGIAEAFIEFAKKENFSFAGKY